MYKVKNRIIASVLALFAVAAVLIPLAGYAEDLATAAVKPVTVECYASVGNTWTLVDTIVVSDDTKADIFGGNANNNIILPQPVFRKFTENSASTPRPMTEA